MTLQGNDQIWFLYNSAAQARGEEQLIKTKEGRGPIRSQLLLLSL